MAARPDVLRSLMESPRMRQYRQDFMVRCSVHNNDTDLSRVFTPSLPFQACLHNEVVILAWILLYAQAGTIARRHLPGISWWKLYLSLAPTAVLW